MSETRALKPIRSPSDGGGAGIGSGEHGDVDVGWGGREDGAIDEAGDGSLCALPASGVLDACAP